MHWCKFLVLDIVHWPLALETDISTQQYICCTVMVWQVERSHTSGSCDLGIAPSTIMVENAVSPASLLFFGATCIPSTRGVVTQLGLASG